jgi:putative ATP-dependent endonuclease of OLD family
MYLERLIIKKFRSIDNLELIFNKGLNILIGENNSGKTAVIDALRICLSYGKQWRELGIKNDEDFFIDTSTIKVDSEPIEFDLYFKIETPQDRYYFTSMVSQDEENPALQDIQLHFRYSLETNPKGNKVLRWQVWGGSVVGQPIKSEEAQLMYFSYLAPLRDAEHELRPYVRENKVTSLFQELTKFYIQNGDSEPIEKQLTLDCKNELAQKLEDVIKDRDWTGVIKTGENFINEHLEKADISNKESKINLRILEYKYDNIVKGILIRKPVYKEVLLEGHPMRQRYFDVSQNGLGENNLIYAAAVLGDLKNRREEEKEHYYALLIEEPEAHLHPQKQNTFFKYLNSLKDFGVQIFITSHSPTITAKSDLDNILVLQKQSGIISSFSIKNSELTVENKGYLRKFLDVTKSQLFFSNGVILVEGISEALLLPIFSRIINIGYDIDKNGIEIVNINGVAFDPFAKLFNSLDKSKRLSSKCSIITDGDENHYEGNLSPRVIKLNGLKTVNSNLEVQLATNTFEYELVTASLYNANLIKQIYESMHPRTNLQLDEDLDSRAKELLEKLESNQDKSELAQKLAYILDTDSEARRLFDVPEYIIRAINWVIPS